MDGGEREKGEILKGRGEVRERQKGGEKSERQGGGGLRES